MTNRLNTGNTIRGRHFRLFGIWLFPYALALFAFAISFVAPYGASLRSPVLAWPVRQDVFGWLLVMIIFSGAWFIYEFSSAANRETIVVELQIDATISTITACFFTGLAGFLAGRSGLEWWLVVPWTASIIDGITSGWLAINNAAQKPFLSDSGTM